MNSKSTTTPIGRVNIAGALARSKTGTLRIYNDLERIARNPLILKGRPGKRCAYI